MAPHIFRGRHAAGGRWLLSLFLLVGGVVNAAHQCPAYQTPPCPPDQRCSALLFSPWKSECVYPSNFPQPNPHDLRHACHINKFWFNDAAMAAQNGTDLAVKFCSTDFNMDKPWKTDSDSDCIYGKPIAERRIPVEGTTYYAFTGSARNEGKCNPPEPWGLNKWQHTRFIFCPPGSFEERGLCVKRWFNEKGRTNCTTRRGQPVDALVGNKRLVEIDWQDSSSSGALTLQRTYNSFGPNYGAGDWPVGHAWRHNFESYVIDSGDGAYRTVLAYRPDGYLSIFGDFSGGKSTLIDEQLTLTVLGGTPASGYEIVDQSGRVETYNDVGRLVSVKDRSQRGTTLTYDANGRLSAVQDTSGRKLVFNYASSASPTIASVTLPNGEAIQYTIDTPDSYGRGVLRLVSYPDAATREYRYRTDTGEILLERVLRNGVDYTAYEYNQMQNFGGVTLRSLATKSYLVGNKNDPADDIAYTFAYTLNETRTATVVTHPKLTTETIQGVVRNGKVVLSEATLGCTGCSGTTTKSTVYDQNGLADLTTDGRGYTTDRDYNSRGLEIVRKEAVQAATASSGCPVGTTVGPAMADCEKKTCTSDQPFPGARHADHLGISAKYFSCPSPANRPAVAPARTTRTEWHPTFAKPVQRTVENSQGVIEQVTRWTYNAREQVTARCHVDATSSAAMAFACDSASAAPLGVRRWTYTYCESADVANASVECPVLGNLKSVNGPRLPTEEGMNGIDDIETFRYFTVSDESGCGNFAGPCHRVGDLRKHVNALGHVTERIAYTRDGQVARMKDANGSFTDFAYDQRGRMIRRYVRALGTGNIGLADATTRLEYDTHGNVTKVTLPDGVFNTYVYDSAGRLTDVIDSGGNRVHYTLDKSGKRVGEGIYDSSYNPNSPSTGLKFAMARTYDSLDRLTAQLNAFSVPVFESPGYDGNGNLTRTKDAFGVETIQEYDGLNRLTSMLRDATGTDPETRQSRTTYVYNTAGRVKSVTDPDSLSTTYTFDSLGNQTALDSPDTGHADYVYDRAGNRTRLTDNRGITAAVTFDSLNRRVSLTYPDSTQNVAFRYDQSNAVTGCTESYPMGRLTQVSDESGATTYCYDRRGNITRKTQYVATAGGVSAPLTSVVSYVYDKADRLIQIVYPSGAEATYSRDGLGRVTGLSWRPSPSASSTAVVSNITYYPFGPVNVVTYGNGRTSTKTYDNDYLIDSITSSAGAEGFNLEFTTNVMGEITAAAELGVATPAERQYEYDSLHRLTLVKDRLGVTREDYSYNKTGDRLSKLIAGQPVENYGYAPGTHRLGTVGSSTRTYDGSGNTLARADNQLPTFTYGARNRLNSAKIQETAGGLVCTDPETCNHQPGSTMTALYLYNALGQRVRKTMRSESGTNIVDTRRTFVFGESGVLLAEYPGSGAVEYLYVDDVPVAVAMNGLASYLETDPLGTPRVAINPGNNAQQWKWDYFASAFGENAAVVPPGGIDVSLRFPGQYLDASTGLNYNYFRDYEASTGRYVESDPIGLRGGLSTYGYAFQRPQSLFDRFGLTVYKCTRPMRGLRQVPHDFLCASSAVPGLQPDCGGHGPKTFWDTAYGEGADSNEKFSEEQCTAQPQGPGDCEEKCLREMITRPRPKYSATAVGVQNCWDWAADTYNDCKSTCGENPKAFDEK
ncbi:RHS repeat-associated core domain-containing protein [Tahibacter amnicola]|uniref:DUF6531 domain-containing protein n=1 Tax=Tahibacter amnicola TaxID=2976241 RepID=A0ABY6BB59_9GAMM|nr:RHS repeat-associated core domain-containing protein [Tahibacter amnicola]UXI67294.1 DUF6531 domain-containing protein [Tahibacter amnicola]